MHNFKDAKGRTWNIAITFGTIIRIKNTVGVDLLKPEEGDPPLIARIGADDLLVGEIINCIISDQYDKHNVSEADVYDSFDGKTLKDAKEAFGQELIYFFQQSGREDRANAYQTILKYLDARIKSAVNQSNIISNSIANETDETTTFGN